MPTIEAKRVDLEEMIGEKLSASRLAALLTLVKGEIKEWTEDILKLELNDTNRPDLWSPEGIARQIRIHRDGGRALPSYPFLEQKAEAQPLREVHVSKDVMAVRPYLAGFLIRGMTITASVLARLIQSQEKLADVFGQKRKSVSIGLYRLNKITFPVRYQLADPDETRLTPLGFDCPMSLREILQNHPKGIMYGEILKDHDRLPILIDAKNQILSFPPIINSREIGEICIGDTDLFVEVTGCNQRMVMLAANIFACNLSSATAMVTPLTIVYPEKTDFGISVKTPHDFSSPVSVALGSFEKALGEPISLEEARSVLTAYGYKITGQGGKLSAQLPPYRDDVMHPIDIIEDFVISRGLESFAHTMPKTATLGASSPLSRFTEQLAQAMVGFGFEEVMSNVLLSYEEQMDRMGIVLPGHSAAMPLSAPLGGRPEQRVIHLSNPMTQRHATPRSWLLPSLLRVEAASSKSYYPHRLFETGEVARMTAKMDGCETAHHLGVLIAHADARFSELHAVLSALLHSLSIPYEMVSISHPTFIEGRTGLIRYRGDEVGFIGEIHPAVLAHWEIGMPAVAFELDIAML